MKRFTQTLPLLLAAALQVMPLLRNIVTSPVAGSSFAFILRWGIGAGAALGAADAVSAATSTFTSTNAFNGTVGTYFSNNVVCSISGGNTAARTDYLYLQAGTNTSLLLTNTASTTFSLPSGLAFKAAWVNGASTIGGYFYGTPTAPSTNTTTVWVVSPGNAQLSQNITITITGSGVSTVPAITSQPASITNAAGANATFNVTASGLPALTYQWVFDTNTTLINSTNASLTLKGIRASQAGAYTVVITNSTGSVTSSIANLVITNPFPPIMTAPAKNGSLFQFTFVPVVGLTNSVLTNSVLAGGVWSAFTNIAPPATTNTVTITDSVGSSNRLNNTLEYVKPI